MNLKQELEKDFLNLQKIMRLLRQLRWAMFNNESARKSIEAAIQALAPTSDSLKLQLEAMQKPLGDYDI